MQSLLGAKPGEDISAGLWQGSTLHTRSLRLFCFLLILSPAQDEPQNESSLTQPAPESRGELDGAVHSPCAAPRLCFPGAALGGQSSTLEQYRNKHPGNSYNNNNKSFEQDLQGSVS